MLSASLSSAGVAGDREYVLIDLKSGLPAAPEKHKKWQKALHLRAKTVSGKLPEMCFPNGVLHQLDDLALNKALSDYFGFAAGVAAYDDVEGRPSLALTQHRLEHASIHLLTTASLNRLATLRQVEAVDSRRFRPTVLIETSERNCFLENEWIGRRMRLGAIKLTTQEKTKRCGITLLSQPGLEEDPEILRNILRHNKRSLGIYCSVDNIGAIQVGDGLFI